MILELAEADVHVLLVASDRGIAVNLRGPEWNADTEVPRVVLSIGGEPGSRQRQCGHAQRGQCVFGFHFCFLFVPIFNDCPGAQTVQGLQFS